MQFAFDPTPKKPAAKTPRRLSKRASRKAAAPAPTASQGSLTTNRSQLFVAAAKQRAVNEHFAELDGEICGEESGEWFGSSFKGPGKNIESEVCTKAKGHDGWHDGGGSTWAPRSAKRKTTASRRTISSLSDKMDFDHVVEVLSDGQVVDAQGVYAPGLYDGELEGSGWTLLDGYSGQDRYSGPIMHASEQIGGGLERDILSQPGYYVALVDMASDDSEPEGWAIAYKTASTTAKRKTAEWQEVPCPDCRDQGLDGYIMMRQDGEWLDEECPTCYGSGFIYKNAKRKTASRRKTAISDGYWAAVDAQIEQLKSARSSADVIRILGPESASSGDAFFNGDGDEMEDALLDAGWRTYRYEAPYYWVMKAPDGSLITYTEGDVSEGDDANVGPKESRRKTASDNDWEGSYSSGEWFYSKGGPYQVQIVYYDYNNSYEWYIWQGRDIVDEGVAPALSEAQEAAERVLSLIRSAKRKTAATAPGYYLVGRASNIIEGPFGSLVQAEARQPEVKAAAIEYKSGVEDPQWESMKAQPFPYGLNTVNGSRKTADNIDDEPEIFMCRECGDDSFSPVCPSCEREMEEYYDRQSTPEPGLAGSFTVWNTGSRKRAYYTDGNGGQYEDDSWFPDSPDTRIGCADCGWSGTAKEADGSNDPSYFYGSDFFCPDCGKNSMLYPLDLDESGDYTFAKRAVENYINNGGR